MKNGKHPVFPIVETDATAGSAGLTKREYFAGLFAAQICAGTAAQMVAGRDLRYDQTNWAEVVAKNAVEFADALLNELDQSPL